MTPAITYGSVCSGIEAVSVAMGPSGWKAAWFAEIEKFPSAVLDHHYPAIKNLGDMTKIAAMVRVGAVAAPDVLVGGTPCQAFSIAGLRAGLSDARGQLTLSFVELANEIDATRHVRGELPCVVWWENVPGVLSDKNNAFGCFLGALSGEDDPLVAPGGKWANAGCVFGPQRTVAWRVFDAQYHGVAQRRRRVFVIASARKGFDPTEVLFEQDGVRRDSPPSREAWQDTAGTVRASAGRRGGVQDECGLGLQPVAFGGNNTSGPIDIATACRAHPSPHLDFESETFLDQERLAQSVTGTLQANGKAAGSATQQDAEAGMLIPVLSAPVARSVERPRGDGLDTLIAQSPPCNTQLGGQHSPRYACLECKLDFDDPYADGTQSLAPAECPQCGDEDAIIDRWMVAAPIAFSVKDYGGYAMVDLSPTLRSGNHHHSHANGGQPPAIAFDSRQDCVSSAEVFGALGSSSPQAQAVAFRVHGENSTAMQGPGNANVADPVEVARCLDTNGGYAASQGGNVVLDTVCVTGQVTHTLKAEGFDASEDGTGRGQPIVAAVREDAYSTKLHNTSSNQAGKIYREYTVSLDANSPPPALLTSMAVRRLTPRECERLQAFPDDWTLIPYGRVVKMEKLKSDWIKYLLRGGVMTLDQVCQAAADGPRYKALGNSMCVFNMRWLGKRIELVLSRQLAAAA